MRVGVRVVGKGQVRWRVSNKIEIIAASETFFV